MSSTCCCHDAPPGTSVTSSTSPATVGNNENVPDDVPAINGESGVGTNSGTDAGNVPESGGDSTGSPLRIRGGVGEDRGKGRGNGHGHVHRDGKQARGGPGGRGVSPTDVSGH